MNITKHHLEKLIAENIRRYEEDTGEAVSELNIRFTTQEGGMVIRKIEVTAEPDSESLSRCTPIRRSGPEILGD